MIRSFQGYIGATPQANLFKKIPAGTKSHKLIDLPSPIKLPISDDSRKPKPLPLPVTDHMKSSMPRLVRPDITKSVPLQSDK